MTEPKENKFLKEKLGCTFSLKKQATDLFAFLALIMIEH